MAKRKAKKKPGRPKTDHSNWKINPVRWLGRIPSAEYDRWCKAAERSDLEWQQWARQVLNAAAKKELK